MDNGVLRIHPLDGSNDFEHFSSFWALNVHDNHHGGIRHIKTSFDDKYVFTAGMDGNFFVFRFMDKAVKGLKVPHKVSIPSAKVRYTGLNQHPYIQALCLTWGLIQRGFISETPLRGPNP